MTFIDQKGEAVLAEITSQGAEFIASDVSDTMFADLLHHLPSDER